MEALLVATLFQAVGSIAQGFQQKNAYDAQAKMISTQAEVDAVELDRRISVEKQAAAQDSLDRAKRLQRIVGSVQSKGAFAGLSTGSGLLNSLVENNQAEASIEEGIARGNSRQSITSLKLGGALNQYNLEHQRQTAKIKGKTALWNGFFDAGTSMFKYASGGVGEVPDTAS